VRHPLIVGSLLIAWTVVFGCGLTASCVHGQSPRQKAQGSLRGDWYDRSTESYRPPTMVEASDHPLRKSGRLASPSKAWNWNFPNWNLGLGGLRSLFTYTILIALVLILLACLVLLVWHFSGGFRSAPRKRENKGISIDPTRVEDLPFAVDQVSIDPLAQARLLAESGDYNKAVIYVYCYLLLALDQAGKLYLQKGKTNRMYLRELNRLSELQEILSQAILKFEQTYFGRIRLTRQDFEALWSELDRFHHLLQTRPEDQFQVELNPATN
jgi:hypothetical protein